MCSLKKISSLLLAFVLAMSTIVSGTAVANAESEHWKLSFGTDGNFIWEGSNYEDNMIDVYSDDEDYGTITSVASADAAVLMVKKVDYGDGFDCYCLKPMKVGSSEVTVEFTTPSGEEKTLAATIEVRKYPKPAKSLKINGKAINTGKYKFEVTRKISKSATKARIKLALKKGWKITDLSAYRSKRGGEGSFSYFKVTKKQLSQGSAIKIPKKYKYVNIGFTMKKGKTEINYLIKLRRK